MMLPLFDVIFVSDSREISILLTYLEFRRISVSHTKEKFWKEEKADVLIFSKFSIQLVEELMDFQKSILLFGKFESGLLYSMLEKGVSLVWETGANALFSFPLEIREEPGWSWVIFTQDRLFDLHLQHLLRAFGHQCYIETDFNLFMERLNSLSAEMAIIDWDVLGEELQDSVQRLKSYKERKQTLVFGIKDFEKTNLYRELSYGIQSISPLLFTKSELISVLLHSLNINNDQKSIPIASKRIQRVQFELQEKNKPIRMNLNEESFAIAEFQDLKESWEVDSYRELLKFLPLVFIKH